MSWSMSGNYLAGCSCALLCGCAVDAQPRDKAGNEQCVGVGVFHIAEGHLDETDLSGVDFALYNQFPSHLTAGDWKIGIVVDTGATDSQAEAVDTIVSGREGGPFEQLSQFFGDYLGMERAEVGISDGDKPRLSVGGRSEIEVTALTGPDGGPTTVKNAMFGFAPEFTLGTASGSSEAFGLTFEGSYGEIGDFAFASDQAEGAATGRG